jgi:hypothetical protein
VPCQGVSGNISDQTGARGSSAVAEFVVRVLAGGRHLLKGGQTGASESKVLVVAEAAQERERLDLVSRWLRRQGSS